MASPRRPPYSPRRPEGGRSPRLTALKTMTSPSSSCARACWAAWAPRAIASRSFAASATRSTAGRGCGTVCGVLRAPVLRALVGASGTASVATAPGLEIGEQKLRTTRSGNRSNRQQKRNPSPLTRIERSCSAFSYRFFDPAAPRRP